MGKVRVREGELVCFAFLIEKTLSYKFKVFDRLSPVIRVPIPQHTHTRAHTHIHTHWVLIEFELHDNRILVHFFNSISLALDQSLTYILGT